MRKHVRFLSYATVFAALLAASGLITYRLMITRMTVEVPDLTGMDISQADDALKSMGLYLKVAGEEHDASVPAGHVLSQDVAPGTDIKGMGEVKVVVSRGPAVEKIPGVLGEKLDEAMKLFTGKGLDIRVIKVHSDTAEEGTIIAQSPAPAEWDGQAITLLASLGPYAVTYYCPSFVGLTKDDALRLAQELGLSVELTEPASEYASVEGQKPLPGQPIAKGGTLHLQLKGSPVYD